jgi:hypothetical protein
MKMLGIGVGCRIVDRDFAIGRASHRLALVVIVAAIGRRFLEPLSHRHSLVLVDCSTTRLLSHTLSVEVLGKRQLHAEAPEQAFFFFVFDFSSFFSLLRYKQTSNSIHNLTPTTSQNAVIATPTSTTSATDAVVVAASPPHGLSLVMVGSNPPSSVVSVVEPTVVAPSGGAVNGSTTSTGATVGLTPPTQQVTAALCK